MAPPNYKTGEGYRCRCVDCASRRSPSKINTEKEANRVKAKAHAFRMRKPKQEEGDLASINPVDAMVDFVDPTFATASSGEFDYDEDG